MTRGRFVYFLLSAAIASGIGYGVARGTAAPPARSSVVLQGDGISDVHFGTSEGVASVDLQQLFGPAAHLNDSEGPQGNCGVDEVLSWPAVQAWFNHGRFVGYSIGALPSRRLAATTARGLRVGDSLGEARRLYGSSLRTSTAQGGAWFVTTARGQIEGFLTNNPRSLPARSDIESIGAGVEGCPAMSP